MGSEIIPPVGSAGRLDARKDFHRIDLRKVECPANGLNAKLADLKKQIITTEENFSTPICDRTKLLRWPAITSLKQKILSAGRGDDTQIVVNFDTPHQASANFPVQEPLESAKDLFCV